MHWAGMIMMMNEVMIRLCFWHSDEWVQASQCYSSARKQDLCFAFGYAFELARSNDVLLTPSFTLSRDLGPNVGLTSVDVVRTQPQA